MDKCMCILYVATLLLMIYIVYNKDIIKEGFQVKLSDNKDMAKKEKLFKFSPNNYNLLKKNGLVDKESLKGDLNNRSKLRPLGYSGGYPNNDSLYKLYGEKSDDANYMRMVVDLDVNYVDPNKEKNEMCAPPGLCDVEKIKRLYSDCETCNTCPNDKDVKGARNENELKGGDINIVESGKDLVEGFDNFGDFSNPGKVFYTDYGGGEKYIPCGECGDGFIRNRDGECQKRVWNGSTYVTDHPEQLLKVNEIEDIEYKGCKKDCNVNQYMNYF